MNTKVVYCIVSTPKDYYYEQLLISLCSLRKHNPTATVDIVCDKETSATFTGNRTKIFEYDINIVPVEAPASWSNWERSRYIKTNLRNLVKGGYLFIDTDTVVCDSLEEIDSCECVVGAVLDSHVPHPVSKTPKHKTELWLTKNAKKVGVDVQGCWHFNSGVFFVKDHPQAYTLYKLWAEKYNECLEKGAKIDQLPLLLANQELGNVITSISPVFNCQAIWKEGRDILPEAKIIHYFPQQGKYIIASPWLLDPMKQTGTIPCTIQSIIDNPQDFFSQFSKVVYTDAMELLRTPLAETYTQSPVFFKMIYWMSRCYNAIKRRI